MLPAMPAMWRGPAPRRVPALPPRQRRYQAPALALCLALLLAAGSCRAQALPDGVHFGMTPAEVLQAAAGPLERVPGARRTAAGATESWRGPVVLVGGVPFDQTFVFARGRLSRVERLASIQATPDGGTAVFEAIVAWGKRTYGPENRMRDPSGEYASWSMPDEDVYVQRTAGPAGVRMVFAQRLQRDPDQL